MAMNANVDGDVEAPRVREKQEQEEQERSNKDGVSESFNPRSIKFMTIMMGMYMSVFLVALVRSPPPPILPNPCKPHPPNPPRTAQ